MKSFKAWKLIHIDLSEELHGLPFEQDVGGVFAVFWYRGIPLGQQEIHAAELPLPATQLLELGLQAIIPAVGDRLFEQGFKAPLPGIPADPSQDASAAFEELTSIERPLQSLWERLAQSEDPAGSPSISVVICTRDRPQQLELCLRSLQASSQLPHEIVVVDNSPSSDATRSLIGRLNGVRYAMEPRAGLDIARNTGIRVSRGDIVAFTDDDVAVHPDWISRLRYSFNSTQVMAVTGLVLPAELETEAQHIFETHWGFNRGYRTRAFDQRYFESIRRRGAPAWEIGAGANMAFRRQVFECIGDFDERLDVGAAGCSGDSEYWYRLLANGLSCHYEPAAVVYHYHRRDMDSLTRQLHYYMRGHVAALLIQFEKHGHWGNLRRLMVSLPGFYLKLFLRGILTGFRSRYRTLFTEVLGCMSGVGFYITHRRN